MKTIKTVVLIAGALLALEYYRQYKIQAKATSFVEFVQSLFK